MFRRFPVDDPNTAAPDENFVFKTVVESLPMTTKRIKDCNGKDPVLTKMYEYTMSG